MIENDTNLERIFTYIDSQKEHYVKDLAEMVSIESVSTKRKHRQHLIEALDWTEKRLKFMGVECNHAVTCDDGDGCSRHPHALLGRLGRKMGKKTILVYGHVDVVPAKSADWQTPPFVLQEVDGILRGRGACTKGPLLCWIHALEAFHATQLPVPLNVKFLIEALRERSSEGLAELIQEKEKVFFQDVDLVCVPAGVWLDNSKPCINYSLRGFLHFKVKVEGAKRDLHSGFYGGMVQEPLGDLVYLLSSLKDRRGRLLVPGLREEDVLPITDDEFRGLREGRGFQMDIQDIHHATGASTLAHRDDNVRVFLHTTRIPSISVHGIEGAYNGPGQKTVIPAKVVGKFSVWLVVNQTVEKTRALVEDYINKLWARRKSPNRLLVDVVSSAEPWRGNPTDNNFQVASSCIEKVFGVQPQVVPSAYSVPFVAHMPPTSSTVIVPVGRPADMLCAPNEGISLHNYVAYVKVFATYIFEIDQLKTQP